MDALVRKLFCQLRYPEKVHSHSKHKFCDFLHSVGSWNGPKLPQQTFRVQCNRMGALVMKPCSQLRYPEIVHSGLKHKFCIFLHFVVFQNAPKTILNNILDPMQMNGCFGYETMFATSVPWNSAFSPKTQVLHLFTFSRFPKFSENTPKKHFMSTRLERMLWLRNHFGNFSTPKKWIHTRNTSFALFYIPLVYEMHQNYPNQHLGSKVVEWMLWLRTHVRNFGILK
jgi:hypothetical protein